MMSDVGGNSVYIASLFDVSSATARAMVRIHLRILYDLYLVRLLQFRLPPFRLLQFRLLMFRLLNFSVL